MKPVPNQFSCATTRLMAIAAVVSTLAFAPGMAFAAGSDAHGDRAELRITSMHAKLKITDAQEVLWAKVADVMREDAKTMDALTQARADHAADMTAIDDLKSYGDIAEAHAKGIRALTPVFADLYASMSDDQKKQADALFRHGSRAHAHKTMKGH